MFGDLVLAIGIPLALLLNASAALAFRAPVRGGLCPGTPGLKGDHRTHLLTCGQPWLLPLNGRGACRTQLLAFGF
jgi:hypothetical protein